MKAITILDAIRDPNLIRRFLGDDLSSWANWLTAIAVLMGLPVPKSASKLIKLCMGRKRRLLPKDGFQVALFLIGRRSGKSKMAAIIAFYEAVLAGHDKKLSHGEGGKLPIISPTRAQSRIIRDYMRAIFRLSPLLDGLVVRETQEGFELSNGISIEILTGDWRSVRGYTLVAAIVDEACFFGYDAESKVKSDTELIRALQPALVTVGGKLIVISSPYARKGWCYTTWKKHFGNNLSKILVWNTSSLVMNPLFPQSVLDAAMAEDMASAKSEYLGEFRDDVALFLPREVIEQCVIKHRDSLLPRRSIQYMAFCDLSGGRNDDSALCIGRKIDDKIVIDCLKRFAAPNDPRVVIGHMKECLYQYGLRRVTGDNYAANFVSDGFKEVGIKYEREEKNRSQLYLELLPRLCSQEIELPDNDKLIDQIANLERRTRSGGRDIVDHPTGGHDDLANVVAGLATIATHNRKLIKAI